MKQNFCVIEHVSAVMHVNDMPHLILQSILSLTRGWGCQCHAAWRSRGVNFQSPEVLIERFIMLLCMLPIAGRKDSTRADRRRVQASHCDYSAVRTLDRSLI